MTPNDVVRRFEQKLLAARTIAASREAFDQYRQEWLPTEDPVASQAFTPLVQQGFEAGYDAAMTAVRGILIPIQSEVLRER